MSHSPRTTWWKNELICKFRKNRLLTHFRCCRRQWRSKWCWGALKLKTFDSFRESQAPIKTSNLKVWSRWWNHKSVQLTQNLWVPLHFAFPTTAGSISIWILKHFSAFNRAYVWEDITARHSNGFGKKRRPETHPRGAAWPLTFRGNLNKSNI